MADNYIEIKPKSAGEIEAERWINASKRRNIVEAMRYKDKVIEINKEGQIKEYKPRKLTPKQMRRLAKQIRLNGAKPIPIRKGKRTEWSLFSNVIKSRIIPKRIPSRFLRRRDSSSVVKLRNMLKKMKLKQQIEELKRRGRFVPMRQIALPRRESFFANPATNRDLFTAFNADMGHADNLWGNEKYFDENFYNEEYYTEDFFGDAGINWNALDRRSGNPLFW